MPMTNVKNYTDAQIIARVETNAAGFSGWKKGIYDVWVRSTEDVTDAFDDKVYTFEAEKAGDVPKFRMVCTGTSHAGSYGLKRFDDYNPEGCAVLEADRIVYDSHSYGFHKNYRAYRQTKGFPYYRDDNRNGKAEQIGKTRNEIILANCHRAAASGESTRIYNWSVACLVRNKAKQWNDWMAFMNKRPLTVCILSEW